MPDKTAQPKSKERVIAFGGGLPRQGMRASSMAGLLNQLGHSGHVRRGPKALDDLYDRHTVLRAGDSRDLSIHGRRRPALDKADGEAALGWLGVDPGLKVAQHVSAPNSNRTAVDVNDFVYARPNAKAAEREQRKADSAPTVYVGLSSGVARRDGGRGVEVRAVAPGSPLWTAGVRPGDVLLAIAQHAVESPGRLMEIGANLKAGKPYLFRVQRAGRQYRCRVTPTEL